jgi:hypothetical protein
VTLKPWYDLPEVKQGAVIIQPYSKYGKAWAMAMGRALKSSEDPDPRAFAGKLFKCDVGFSSRGPDGSYSYKHSGKKKGPRDFLRVHEIIGKT